MYSFKEEVVLFKSIVIFNFVWSAFTLLAAKVAITKKKDKHWTYQKKDEHWTYHESWFTIAKFQFPEFFLPPVVFYIINLIFFSYQVSIDDDDLNLKLFLSIQDIFQGVILPLYVLFKGNRSTNVTLFPE